MHESHFAAASKPLSPMYANGHILQSHPQMLKDPQVLPRGLHEGIVLCFPHNDAQLAAGGCGTKDLPQTEHSNRNGCNGWVTPLMAYNTI